ncbi:MAG: LLM class flavin-dependent oxidoreductase [Candidatus Xenobia bacterium]
MKIGLFYEHQAPRPWDADTDYRILHEAAEQIEFADKLGFDYVWLVEHHFLEEYSHCSAPEIFLSYVAARTRQIRLGHGIVLMPWKYNHPVRVAERISTLDLLSNGRVEFGAGESASEAELGGFGIDPREKRAMWEQGLRVAVSCMTRDPFPGYVGDGLTIPPRNVLPKPRQKPHPPLWMANTRMDFTLGAQLGLGVLSFAFLTPQAAQQGVEAYYREMEEHCVPLGETVNPNVACVAFVMCAPTQSEAQKRAADGPPFFEFCNAHYYFRGTPHQPGKTDLWRQFESERPTGFYPGVDTPDEIRKRLMVQEQAGIDQVICIMQAGRNRHEHIMESLELLGTQVLPDFKERDVAFQKKKAERMAPIIERAMQRKKAQAPAPADYQFNSPAKTKEQRLEVDAFYRSLNGAAPHAATAPGGSSQSG